MILGAGVVATAVLRLGPLILSGHGGHFGPSSVTTTIPTFAQRDYVQHGGLTVKVTNLLEQNTIGHDPDDPLRYHEPRGCASPLTLSSLQSTSGASACGSIWLMLVSMGRLHGPKHQRKRVVARYRPGSSRQARSSALNRPPVGGVHVGQHRTVLNAVIVHHQH